MKSRSWSPPYPRKNWPALAAAAWVVVGCGGAPSGPNSAAQPVASSGSAIAPVATVQASAGVSVDHSGVVVPVLPEDPTWGAPDAPVTLVEFADLQCPFTARVQPTLQRLQQELGPQRLRIVWKHLPLPFHKRAFPAHDASVVVQRLGGNQAFFRFVDDVIAAQSTFTPAQFPAFAKRAGVDEAAFNAAFSSDQQKVAQDLELAAKLGVRGTPGFLINGVRVSGAQPYDKFREVIDAQLLEAEQLAKTGVASAQLYPQLTAKNYAAPEPEPQRPSREPEVPDDTVWNVPVLKDDPVRGAANPLVTIVEFSDFQCPFCSRVEPTLDKVLETYPKDVRIAWKDNPLPFHQDALPAARLARAVYQRSGNAAFWKVHGELFKQQKQLDEENLERISKQLGFDWKKLADAREKAGTRIQESIDLAYDVQARGTPHFFINGVRLSGAQPFDKFDEAVKQQLEVARKLVTSGVPRAKVYETLLKTAKQAPELERRELPAAGVQAPFRGNPNAEIVITEFSDFECPFCSRAEQTLIALEQEFPGKLKIVWRHYPLPFHPHAEVAAQAAQEVFEQKGNAAFALYQQKLFAEQGQPAGFELSRLASFAAEAGADPVRFRKAVESRTHSAKIEADKAAAQAAGVSGTPAFFINGYFVSGAQPLPVFRRIVKRALADAAAAKTGAKGVKP